MPVSEKTLLIMGNTAFTPWGRDQLRRLSAQARARGLRLWGADTPANLERAPAEDLALVDEVLALDVHDVEACRRWAATRPPIDAVATIRELSVLPCAHLAQDLGLAGNHPDAVNAVRNKDLCREVLRKAGLPQPVTELCRTPEDAYRFMADHPGPWIVKPRDGMAGIGVTRVDDASRLPDALDRFGAPPAAMGTLPRNPYYLIETFVSGAEYSAEGVMTGGVPQVLALTRKTTVANFVELGHREPSGLDPRSAAEAEDAVRRALTAVGITRGIFHVEFWATADGIVLGELHDRGGGDFIHAMVEHVRPGLELYGTLVDDLLGRTPAPVPASSGSARAQFLVAPPGVLRAVHGWDAVAAHPAVLAAHLQVEPGDVIGAATDSYSRSAVFVAGLDTPEGIDELAARLAAGVTFEMESVPQGPNG
jgi:phosphoribosylaminoimidazole carboxylase (NCAIR synthetase)